MVKNLIKTVILAISFVQIPVFSYFLKVLNAQAEKGVLYVAIFADNNKEVDWRRIGFENATSRQYSPSCWCKKYVRNAATVIISGRPMVGTVTVDQARSLVAGSGVIGLSLNNVRCDCDVYTAVEIDYDVRVISCPQKETVWLKPLPKDLVLPQSQEPLLQELEESEYFCEEVATLTEKRLTKNTVKKNPSTEPQDNLSPQKHPYMFSLQSTLFLTPPPIQLNICSEENLIKILTCYEIAFSCIKSLIDHDEVNSIWKKRLNGAPVPNEWLKSWMDHIFQCAKRVEFHKGRMLQSYQVNQVKSLGQLLDQTRRVLALLTAK